MMSTAYFRSLRFGLLAISGAVLIALSLATAWGTNRVLTAMWVDDFEERIRQTGELLKLAMAPLASSKDPRTIQSGLDELVDGANGQIVYLAVLDDKRHVIAGTRHTPGSLPDPALPIQRQIPTGMVHVSQPIPVGGRNVMNLSYGLSTTSFNEGRNRVIWIILVLLVMALGELILLADLYGVLMGRRLAPLIDAARALKNGDMSSRVQRAHVDELSGLAEVFNDMADALQKRMEKSKAHQAEVCSTNEKLMERIHESTGELQDMVRAVSHDLRAPLGGIAGLAKLAAAALELGDDSLARTALPNIVRQAIASESMLEGLLCIARIGETQVACRDVNLQVMVRDVIAQLAMHRPNVAMPRFVLGELPIMRTDPSLLRPALLNLIGNAVKFCASSEQPLVEIGCTPSESGAGFHAFYIKDNGTGFEQSSAARLFTPFVRLHGDEYDGHGVGLSIVQRAIHKLGGEVWADAAPGAGATFHFTLPAGV
ncbi:MAG: ATP-binding protein [Aquabacterium sp.]